MLWIPEGANVPNFTARVELRQYATTEQYDRLHESMYAIGFLRSVVGEDRQGQRSVAILPPGLYFGASNSSCSDVRWTVKQIANSVDQTNKVFVAETVNWSAA